MPESVNVTVRAVVVGAVRLTVNTPVSLPGSAASASLASTVMVGRSLSAMVTVIRDGVPRHAAARAWRLTLLVTRAGAVLAFRGWDGACIPLRRRGR